MGGGWGSSNTSGFRRCQSVISNDANSRRRRGRLTLIERQGDETAATPGTADADREAGRRGGGDADGIPSPGRLGQRRHQGRRESDRGTRQEHLSARINGLDGRINGLDGRINGLERKIGGGLAKLRGELIEFRGEIKFEMARQTHMMVFTMVGIAVAAAGVRTCALRDDGTATCWGYDNYGQNVAPDDEFIALAASAMHACGLRADNTIGCWGEPLTVPPPRCVRFV